MGAGAQGRSLTAGEMGDLYDGHARALHRYLARRYGSGIADDLVAETFLAAWQHRGRYDPDRAPARAWLYGIATNIARQHARSELRRLRATASHGARADSAVSTDDVGSRAAATADAAATVAELAERLLALSAPDREVLLLVAWSGLEPIEVAQALGIPVGTVRSRLHRARTSLRGVKVSSDA